MFKEGVALRKNVGIMRDVRLDTRESVVSFFYCCCFEFGIIITKYSNLISDTYLIIVGHLGNRVVLLIASGYLNDGD